MGKKSHPRVTSCQIMSRLAGFDVLQPLVIIAQGDKQDMSLLLGLRVCAWAVGRHGRMQASCAINKGGTRSGMLLDISGQGIGEGLW